MMQYGFDRSKYAVDRNKSHGADSAAIVCVDHRFRREVNDFLTDVFGNVDLMGLAGGAQNLVSEHAKFDAVWDIVLGNLDICRKLHNIKTIVLIIHSDCGAYGGLAKFEGNERKEFDYFKEELNKAYACVKEKFPDVEIVKVIFGFNGPELVH